jgi:hypothetical protein
MWFATLWAAISFVAVYLWVHNEPAARKIAAAAEPGS